MNLLELINEFKISPKRSTSTKGGEYHSACPECGGRDRFIVWPLHDRYWCRQCGKKGDAVQFCRDFLGLNYQSACAKVGMNPKIFTCAQKFMIKHQFFPETVSSPSETWQKKSKEFVSLCHENLLVDANAMQLLYKRGFSLNSIHEFSLGWNPISHSIPLNEWNLPVSFKEDGKERRLWLPKGIVIPTLSDGYMIKLKIRRSDWHIDDQFPKYLEISGSMKSPALYGNMDANTIIITEAELDAMLIQQYASDLCCCMTIGGVGKKPDLDSDHLLRKADRILFALDFDEAGKKAYKFWKSTYANLRPWPAPKGKSPGDACVQGVDLRYWVKCGIKEYNTL